MVRNGLRAILVTTTGVIIFSNDIMRPQSRLVSETCIDRLVTVQCFMQRSPSEKPLK